MKAKAKMTLKNHEADSDDADLDADFDDADFDADFDDFDVDSDDVDSRNEILFWKSFWDAKSSSLSTLLNEKWISKNDEQSMTTNLIDVCICLTEKNEISSIFVDLVFFIFCWRMR